MRVTKGKIAVDALCTLTVGAVWFWTLMDEAYVWSTIFAIGAACGALVTIWGVVDYRSGR